MTDNKNQVAKLEGEAINSPQQRPMDAFRDTLIKEKSKLEKVLPAHITFEKFQSSLITACMQNPLLLHANRQSLMFSCIKAATDGLLPDGRDAALVIFNAKLGKDDSGKDIYGQKVQYMPMYAGILKKVRQSKDLSAISTQVVYTNDIFKHRLGDADEIIHEVNDGNSRGEFKAVYCIAKLKDGTIMKDVMYKNDVEKIRKVSKSGNDKGEPKGIWKDWYDEMAKKTVFRRLAKWLPQSTDKDDIGRIFDNDESMDVIDSHIESESYTVEEKGEEETKQIPNQPDLKQEIVEKEKEKVASNPVEKQEVAKESEPEKNLLEIEQNIRKAISEALDYASAYAITEEYAAELSEIEAKKAGAYLNLKIFIDKRLKQLEGK